MNRPLLLLLPLLAGACDRDALEMGLLPEPSDVPAVLDLGVVEPMTEDEWWDPQARIDHTLYADLGAPEPGERGGATLTFRGTGANLCVIVDPEAVFWNQAVSANPGPDDLPYTWPDNYDDDGDLDLYVGYAANYTGTPGVEIGDFVGRYTDALGQEVEIEYDLCTMIGLFGQEHAHAGRASPEYCDIDTDAREGVEYTALLKTFSLPLDDSVLSFAVAVVETDPGHECLDLRDGGVEGIGECALRGESPEPGFEELEQAFCDEDMANFCAEHPEMCGEP